MTREEGKRLREWVLENWQPMLEGESCEDILEKLQHPYIAKGFAEIYLNKSIRLAGRRDDADFDIRELAMKFPVEFTTLVIKRAYGVLEEEG